MLYVAILNYEEPALLMIAIPELDDEAPSDDIEAFLTDKGYNVSNIHYMTSNKPFPVYTDQDCLVPEDITFLNDEEL